MRAFVTDGDQRPALAITRSLGRRGVSVLVGEERGASLASASKYCSGHATYPSPQHHQQAFDRFLLEFVQREHVDVVVPVTDVAMHSIAANQQAIQRHSATACPPFDAFEMVTDKWALVQRALICGVPVPKTHFVASPADLEAGIARMEFPAVVKPTRSRIPTGHGWIHTAVRYASSPGELWRLYRETDYLAGHPWLIQERIVGSGLAIFVLFDRGELLTSFAHRRLREKPPAGGVSVLSESVAVDPELREFAIRLLGPLGWHGAAMLEFKRDDRTGKVFLMEVNGRFWGSLQLAVEAGVDFPHLACQLALGERPSVPAAYRIGIKNRWLLGDLDHLLLRLAHGRRDLNLSDSAPSTRRAIVDFLKFVQPAMSYEVICRTDPAPFLYELSQYARTLAGSAARRVHKAAGGAAVARQRLARPSPPLH
jgi:predicted ATP-grasp superfamily ATP-dependent carboligase